MKNNKEKIDIVFIIALVAMIVLFFLIIFAMIFPIIVGNRTLIDLKYKYTRAIISLNEETIYVEVDRWCDYGGEQIQIIGKDGKTYLASSFNTVLIGE